MRSKITLLLVGLMWVGVVAQSSWAAKATRGTVTTLERLQISVFDRPVRAISDALVTVMSDAAARDARIKPDFCAQGKTNDVGKAFLEMPPDGLYAVKIQKRGYSPMLVYGLTVRDIRGFGMVKIVAPTDENVRALGGSPEVMVRYTVRVRRYSSNADYAEHVSVAAGSPAVGSCVQVYSTLSVGGGQVIGYEGTTGADGTVTFEIPSGLSVCRMAIIPGYIPYDEGWGMPPLADTTTDVKGVRVP